jgi:hypothetical protein
MYVYFLDQSRFQDVISNIISPFNDDSHNEQLLICFTKRKWVDTLFHYRQQHEALGSLVEPLSKEKEKDNVLIDLELVNLKSASLLDFEKLKRRTTKAKKEEVGGCK